MPAHSELQWLLNCVTPIGWLNRMIQFKEKARKQVRPSLISFLGRRLLIAPCTQIEHGGSAEFAPVAQSHACLTLLLLLLISHSEVTQHDGMAPQGLHLG